MNMLVRRIVGIGDASFKTSEKAIGGIILLLTSRDMKIAIQYIGNLRL